MLNYIEIRAGEIAQWRKVLTTNPDNLTSVFGTRWWQYRTNPQELLLDRHMPWNTNTK